MSLRTVPLWRQRNFQLAAGGIAAVVVVAAAILALSGGSGGGGGSSASSSPARTTTKAGATTTSKTRLATAPLTGLPDEGGAAATREALAVKVDNVALAKRPDQAGLDLADVVYEEPVESATRFVAIFNTHAVKRVGPVRSTRFIDPGIMWPIHGLYVFSGGTPPKVAAIREAPVQTLDETALAAADARIRDAAIPAPHNLFVIPNKVWAVAHDTTPPAPLFTYLPEGAAFDGDPAATVEIPSYSQARYTWDAGSGTWLREEVRREGGGREPHLAESGKQIAPTNLIVQVIAGTEDKADLVGDGDAWVLSAGKVLRGRWHRASLDERTTFLDSTGAEVRLTPGTTWVHLITSGAPTISAG